MAYPLFQKLLVVFITSILSLSSLSAQSRQDQIDSLNRRSFAIRVESQDEALSLSYEALSLNSDVDYQLGYYESCLNLGIIYTNLSKYDSAFSHLRKCLTYFKTGENSGLTHYYLGINYSNLRDFDQAEGHFAIAQGHFQKAESIEYLAYVNNSMGIVNGRQGNYSEALEWFLKAYRLKINNELLYDEELTNISIVYRLMGKYDESLNFLKKSVVINAQKQDSLGVAQVYISMAKVHMAIEQYDSAMYYLDEARAISLRNHFDRQTASALTNKAALLIDLNKYDEAISLLKWATTLVPADDDVTESVYATLSEVYVHLKQIDSAIYYGEKAYETSIKGENLVMSKAKAQDLAAIYESEGDLPNTINYLKKYVAHSDSLHAKTRNSELSDLRVNIETLEKNHEIDLLNAEKELRSLEKERLVFAFVAALAIATLIIILLVFRAKEVSRSRKLKELTLKNQIESGQEDLYKQTLHMIHVNNTLNGIEEQLKANEDSQKILSIIRLNKSLDKDWKNFNNYFGNVHSGFYETLTKISAELSSHEKRVCALLKINLSNREIATILNIEPKSVAMIKYRVKKKLHLSEDQDLVNYLQSISS